MHPAPRQLSWMSSVHICDRRPCRPREPGDTEAATENPCGGGRQTGHRLSCSCTASQWERPRAPDHPPGPASPVPPAQPSHTMAPLACSSLVPNNKHKQLQGEGWGYLAATKERGCWDIPPAKAPAGGPGKASFPALTIPVASSGELPGDTRHV